MTDWLLDTLVWTAALIGLVLLIRRPVANAFGPQFAYALWALPMIRLALPPIELPAWLAPATTTTQAQANELPTFDPATFVATPEAVAGPVEGAGLAASDAAATSWTLQGLFELIPLFELALVVWLTGAATFLYLRFSAYFQLRGDLLQDAREVGRAGRIRLIETPGTTAPLAFGVQDPVIAMPPGFMAMQDRTARDLALAHELEHHDGRDLLINILVQPLFAMHWWNPLGRYGWLALRRDQEAACDARVMASRPAESRAAYANVIAGFAAGPNVAHRNALAAPMACPVLGEKSIIQRLRSLKMSDTSPRRRVAGRLMLGAAVLALPLTASISYAETAAPTPPAPPSAPDLAIAPPAPPAPPAAPVAPLAQEIVTIDPDSQTEVIETEDGRTVVIKREIERTSEVDGEKKGVRTVKIVDRGGHLSEEEREEMMREVRAGLAEAEEAIKDVPAVLRRAMIDMDTTDADGKRTVVKMDCRGKSGEVAKVEEGKDRLVYLCESEIMAQAYAGLKQARDEIARNRDMEIKLREEILRELDSQLARWKKEKG